MSCSPCWCRGSPPQLLTTPATDQPSYWPAQLWWAPGTDFCVWERLLWKPWRNVLLSLLVPGESTPVTDHPSYWPPQLLTTPTTDGPRYWPLWCENGSCRMPWRNVLLSLLVPGESTPVTDHPSYWPPQLLTTPTTDGPRYWPLWCENGSCRMPWRNVLLSLLVPGESTPVTDHPSYWPPQLLTTPVTDHPSYWPPQLLTAPGTDRCGVRTAPVGCPGGMFCSPRWCRGSPPQLLTTPATDHPSYWPPQLLTAPGTDRCGVRTAPVGCPGGMSCSPRWCRGSPCWGGPPRPPGGRASAAARTHPLKWNNDIGQHSVNVGRTGLFNDALNTFYLLARIHWSETTTSVNTWSTKEGHGLFNDALNTFYLLTRIHWSETTTSVNTWSTREGQVYLTTHSTHFICSHASTEVKQRHRSTLGQRREDMFYLTTHSTHFICSHASTEVKQRHRSTLGQRGKDVLFNDALNTFYLLHWSETMTSVNSVNEGRTCFI